MSSKHKIKRIERIFGWTKASHKNAIRYFSDEKPELKKSLKRKKVCKFTKGEHKFIVTKIYEPNEWSGGFKTLACELCGKKDYEFQKKETTLKD